MGKEETILTYRETLPPSCPPETTSAPSAIVLWRLLKANTIACSDFDSAAFKSPSKDFEDPCDARGISLVTDLNHCKVLSKSPRMKHFKFAVGVTYDPNAGTWHQDSRTHVNWWVFKGCDPLTLVVGKIESLA